MSTIFQKIIDKQIPADIVYEDDRALAFKDIHPQAPVHYLLVPKKVIPAVADVTEADRALIGHLYWVAGEIARKENIADFRLITNNGKGAGQEVFHLHIHMMAGRSFGWPPG